MEEQTIGELVRQMETSYTRGNVTISEYVNFDMYATINQIEAYLNSVHISGKTDSQDREKPFFNIVVSSSNIWYRATDIDRSNIKIKATKREDVIDAFLATIHLQNWMTKAQYGQYLNEWGRVLARYGSAVTKFVERDGELIISVVPWNRIICDPIDFENNPKIEILELTEAQLRKNKNYDPQMVEALINAKQARETLRRNKKDSKNDYFKLYEVHGELPLSYLTDKESDETEYVQQMQVVSFVESKKKGEYEDFALYKGRERQDPYLIDHLIKEDGRTLAIGAVEHLFESQWMVNHSAKAVKDQLDLASKLIFQTADEAFVGQNALSAIETGDILIHKPNMPLEQVGNNSHDVTALMNQGQQWKSLGNEITGISEAMLGVAPKSGTAWRQTQALLQESYSLFELMTENKGLAIERQLREYIIPFIKRKHLDNADEIAATLEANDIDWVDSRFIKNFSVTNANNIINHRVINMKEMVRPDEQMMLTSQLENQARGALDSMGGQRFFKPDEIKGNTWKKQFKDIEWELEIDVTSENKDYQSVLATLNTALQVAVAPGYAENKEAQMIVGKILMSTGQLSPLELSSLRNSTVSSPPGGNGAVLPTNGPVATLPTLNKNGGSTQ